MGLDISQDITLNNGITLNAYHANIGNSSLKITKEEDTFVVEGCFSLWYTKDAKDRGVSPVGIKFVNCSVLPGQNPYDALYAKYKEELTSFTDN